MVGRYGLRQHEVEQRRVCESERAREDEGHADARNVVAAQIDVPAAQHAADGRAEDEAEAEGRADQTHPLRSVLFGRHVGDVGLRGRDVAARDAVNDSAREEHPELRRKSQDEEPCARPQEREEEYGPPPVPVRQAAQHRREQELHDRVGRKEQTHHARARVELRPLDVERQDGDDDAEAHEVYEDRYEDDQQRRAAHSGF